MKIFSACLLFLFSSLVFASEVSCFSGKTRIYHGFVKDINVTDDFITFTEIKTNHTIYVNSDCVIIY